jgi:N-glycosidase YbiA
LVEHTARDSYWADGGNGQGKNRLGVLLMRLRDELSTKAEDTEKHTKQQ